MRINGNKLCPHCGCRHTLFRPFSKPPQGWKCPQCGRLLTTDRRRVALVVLIPVVVLFVLFGYCQTTAHRLLAITVAWFGVGTLVAHLALDVRAADERP
ncbi:hypothetical protein H8E07_21205 [bacterium]|nr:hypothetical protein [bacterium]